jgi:hypothetical protein
VTEFEVRREKRSVKSPLHKLKLVRFELIHR